jgi:hypothetical protein
MHLSDQLTALAAGLTAVWRVVDRRYRTSHYWGRLIQVKLRTIINILFWIRSQAVNVCARMQDVLATQAAYTISACFINC